jgi:hypothetical protein
MKSYNYLYAFLMATALNIFTPCQAKNIYALNADDSSYFAEMSMLTGTGKGYFIKSFPEHSENWQEVMQLCLASAKQEKFSFPITIAIRPSGKVANIYLHTTGLENKNRVDEFANCVGGNLMRGNYPEHPFPVFFLKFNATSTPGNYVKEIAISKNIGESGLIGLWKSEQNGSYIKINKLGRAYYCLYNAVGTSAIKIVAMGNVDKNNNILWGKFWMLNHSEVFDLKEDLKRDMGAVWSQNIEAGVMKTYSNGLADNTYLKSNEMDIMCD